MEYQVTYMTTEFGRMVKKIAFINGPELFDDESNVKVVENEIDEIMFREFGRSIKVMSMKPIG